MFDQLRQPVTVQGKYTQTVNNILAKIKEIHNSKSVSKPQNSNLVASSKKYNLNVRPSTLLSYRGIYYTPYLRINTTLNSSKYTTSAIQKPTIKYSYNDATPKILLPVYKLYQTTPVLPI